MFRATQMEITDIKEKLSDGKSRSSEGGTRVEVGLSDLNKLLELAYKHEQDAYTLGVLVKGFLARDEKYPVFEKGTVEPSRVDRESNEQLLSDAKEAIEKRN